MKRNEKANQSPKILRYCELALKEKGSGHITWNEMQEMASIEADLKMSRESILETGKKKLVARMDSDNKA